MDDSVEREKGLLILVLEDSDRLLRSLCLALVGIGHRVDDVADGELALELARDRARESERDRARCLVHGVDEYRSKRFAIEGLVTRLDGLR